MMRHICEALTALAIFLVGSALALTPERREAGATLGIDYIPMQLFHLWE